MDKIGSGEGAQSFGYGFYGAEGYGVAKYYRDTLAGPKKMYLDSSFFSDEVVAKLEYLGFSRKEIERAKEALDEAG